MSFDMVVYNKTILVKKGDDKRDIKIIPEDAIRFNDEINRKLSNIMEIAFNLFDLSHISLNRIQETSFKNIIIKGNNLSVLNNDELLFEILENNSKFYSGKVKDEQNNTNCNFLAFPIRWPNQEIFGLFILSYTKNQFSHKQEDLLHNFVSQIETELSLLYTKIELEKQTKEKFDSSYTKIFKETFSVMLLVDAENGDIVDANSAACNFYGYTLDELKKQNIYNFNTMPREFVRKQINMALESKKNEFIFKHKLANSTIKDVKVNTNKITINSKNYLLSIIYDITEKLKIENDLKNNNIFKDKLFSIISHDLKSPFSSIIGLAEFTKNNIESFSIADIKEYINLIYGGAQKVYKLLDNLLIWANSQRGNIEYYPQELSFDTIVNSIVELFEQNIKNKNIEIKYLFRDIKFTADKNMLEIILRNLISNAIKFTPKNGRITIEVEEDNNDYIINIKDSGIGIKRENINKIFDTSCYYSTFGTTGESGTGLGLILCKEFIEKHGGKIWVDSVFGKGSSFYFKLPKTNSPKQ